MRTSDRTKATTSLNDTWGEKTPDQLEIQPFGSVMCVCSRLMYKVEHEILSRIIQTYGLCDRKTRGRIERGLSFF